MSNILYIATNPFYIKITIFPTPKKQRLPFYAFVNLINVQPKKWLFISIIDLL